jgi:AcrR family transcriptional regulator
LTTAASIGEEIDRSRAAAVASTEELAEARTLPSDCDTSAAFLDFEKRGLRSRIAPRGPFSHQERTLPQFGGIGVIVMNIKSTRQYTMTARAESAARTPERVVAATRELFSERAIADITLADIAAGAGVTVQTVLRRFGDRDGVWAAVFEACAAEVYAQRGRVDATSLDGVVDNLVDHYDEWGATMIKMLSEEATTPSIRPTLTEAAGYHQRWCEAAFSASLATLSAPERRRRLAQLVAVCDLRTWETLRLRCGLSTAETRRALRELLKPLGTVRD